MYSRHQLLPWAGDNQLPDEWQAWDSRSDMNPNRLQYENMNHPEPNMPLYTTIISGRSVRLDQLVSAIEQLGEPEAPLEVTMVSIGADGWKQLAKDVTGLPAVNSNNVGRLQGFCEYHLGVRAPADPEASLAQNGVHHVRLLEARPPRPLEGQPGSAQFASGLVGERDLLVNQNKCRWIKMQTDPIMHGRPYRTIGNPTGGYLPGTGSSTKYLSRSLGSKDLHDKLRPVGSVRGRDHCRDLHDERLLQEGRAESLDWPHLRKLNWEYNNDVHAGGYPQGGVPGPLYKTDATSEPPHAIS